MSRSIAVARRQRSGMLNSMDTPLPPANTRWPDHILSDFSWALLRVATLTSKGRHHLLFGCVELFPPEVPGPDSLPAEQQSIGRDQLVASATVLPVDAALAWYEAALRGALIIPGLAETVSLETVALAAEPDLGHLVIAASPPGSAPWHGGTRLHRLVPMQEPPELVRKLRSAITYPDHTAKARRWLKERLHFDVLDADAALGGLVMLVPNPVVRSIVSFPLEVQAGSGEVIRVQANARDGHGYDTLEVTLREERPDGTFLIERARLDALGQADFMLPHRAEKVGLELRCDLRGLLTVQPCTGWIRSISLGIRLSQTQLAVAVPGRRRSAPTTHYTTPLMATLSESHVGPPPDRGAASRLVALLDREAARISAATGVERVFYEDRAGAVEFLRALVQGGLEHVVFVDPFFGAEDLLEFATAVMSVECRVGVIRSRQEGLWAGKDSAPNDQVTQHPGAALFTCIEQVNGVRAGLRMQPVDVRLMGGKARVYHDRFLLVNGSLWHVGHSFNQIGGVEVSMVTRVAASPVIAWILEDLDQAESFASVWPAMLASRTAATSPATESAATSPATESSAESEPRCWAVRLLGRVRPLASKLGSRIRSVSRP